MLQQLALSIAVVLSRWRLRRRRRISGWPHSAAGVLRAGADDTRIAGL